MKFKLWFLFRAMWHHQVNFGMKSGLPQTTFSPPQKEKKYKWVVGHLFYFILNVGPLKPWHDHHLSTPAQQYTNCTPFPLISRYFSSQPWIQS